MSRLEMILSASLLLSVIFNVGIFVYARASVSRLLMVSEELGDLQNMVNSFSRHLKSVYELEMFYGDQTLEHLLNHAVSFNEQLETFEFIYSLTEQETIESEKDNIYSDDTEEDPTPPSAEN
jgi:hypothetical protein